MSQRTLTLLQLLEAVQYALNAIPNQRLRGCPHDIQTSYELARRVDEHVYFRQENKEEGDG